jgi:hypothetical protein
VKRGLASPKTRRRRTRNEFMQALEFAPYVKALIVAVFAGGLALLIFNGEHREPTKTFLIALLFFGAAVVQLWINQPSTFGRSSRLLLVFGIIFVQLAATKVLLIIAEAGTIPFLRSEVAVLLAPYAFAPLVLCSVLLGRNHGCRGGVRQLVDAHSVWCFDARYLQSRCKRIYGGIHDAPGRRRSRLIRAASASASRCGCCLSRSG